MEEQNSSVIPIDKNRFIKMIDDLKKNRTEKTPGDPKIFQQILNTSKDQ